MLSEAIVEFLARPNAALIDATVGDGGHAVALLEASGTHARLLGIDLDLGALAGAERVLAPYGERVHLVHGTFADLQRVAEEYGFGAATGVLFDLGLRAGQLEARRGFSFLEDAVLDMRFDSSGRMTVPEPEHLALRRLAHTRPAYTAADILARLPEADLADIFWRYGDEWHARRIARALVATRKRSPITTTRALVLLVVRALPPRARHRRIHAATKVFQALRIAVNREFESLRRGLAAALTLLAPGGSARSSFAGDAGGPARRSPEGEGGRIAVISYHSGEDRIAKEIFRDAARRGHLLLTRRPLRPSTAAVAANPRSRSAKLRILERPAHP